MDNSFNYDTIQYFSNSSIFNKIIVEQNNKHKESYSKEDLKFYRKRILQLFKNVIHKKNTDSNLTPIVDEFITKSIEYLKFIDKRDAIQEQYSTIKNKTEKGKRVHFKEDTDAIYNEANELMFHTQEPEKLTIDKQMNIISFRETPAKDNNIELPKYKRYNLHDPKLKTKGVKKKKKKNKKTKQKKEE